MGKNLVKRKMWKHVDSIDLDQDRYKWRALAKATQFTLGFHDGRGTSRLAK